MPFLTRVAAGKISKFTIYGNDYPTPDKTAVRDYIHVVDLAKAHAASLKYLLKNEGFSTFNIGTGKGVSVLEMVNEFLRTCDVSVPIVLEKEEKVI